VRTSHRSEPKSRRPFAIVGAVLVLVLVTLAGATAVRAVRVEGISMAPTLHNGERVMLRPFSGGDTPARFAVVVTKFSAGGPTVVKRVVGLPGDRVRIDTVNGATTVEVQPGGAGPWRVVDNPAWTRPWGFVRCCRPDGHAGPADPQVVPDGMLFLLGDNAAVSQDSRSFGWAPVDLVDGVVRWRLRAWVVPAGFGSDVQLGASRSDP
jgi:signal peptidase I